MRGMRLFLVLVLVSMQGCATMGHGSKSGLNSSNETVSDPLESMNQKVFSFNMGLYDYVLEPVAKGYEAVTPQTFRTGVANFFNNATYPYVFMNDFLQGRTDQGLTDFSRFLANTVIGIGGLFDVASHMQLPPHQNSFGVTLGVWGVPQGAYLVLPFLGPASVRSLPGIPIEILSSPFYYITNPTAQWSITAMGIVNTGYTKRGEIQLVKQSLFPYYFARSAWEQHEQYLIRGSKLNHRRILEKLGPDEEDMPKKETLPFATPKP
ncbi:MAG TPA: VacJ family lipoprotein [Burkholderiales bacterium]|nr:VacJ family lipoprotein [Burkholderiales bacterium]